MYRNILIACGLLLLVNVNRAQAQYPLHIMDWYDSSYVSHCSVPAEVLFNLAIQGSVDNPITVYIDWDDGTDTIIDTTYQNWDWWSIGIYHTFTAAGVYYPHVLAVLDNGDSVSMDMHFPAVINDSCSAISGTVYIDENQNCVYDGDDVLYECSIGIKLGGDTIKESWNPYHFDLQPNTNYTLYLPDLSSVGLSPLCPNSWTYDFSLDNGNLTQDFALACSTTLPDNQIQNAWVTGALPGDDCYMSVTLDNPMCLEGSGTVTFELDSIHQYVDAEPVPDLIDGNQISFNFNNVQTFNSVWNQFNASIHTITSPNALCGSYFCIPVTVTPDDLDMSNNFEEECGTVGGPFDPNHLRVSPLGAGAHADIPPGTELTYTAEFQNTGNAPAINVHVIDTLESDFDLSTFELIDSSHPVTYTLNQNILTFSFLNIMLPDEGSDEEGSHAWVRYKIKPNDNSPLGTVLNNRVFIYFDGNAPVKTNTTINTINGTAGVSSVTVHHHLTAFPNPTSDLIQVTMPDNFSGDIYVLDLMGKIIWSTAFEGKSYTLDCGLFPSGLYGLFARNGSLVYQGNFTVQK